MLNGIAPLLIFTFKTPGIVNTIRGIPKVGNFLATNVGLPIPIYLDEKLTGIYVKGESRGIDVETKTENLRNKENTQTSIIYQSALNNTVTVNMIASRKGVMLVTLLALMDMIFQRVVSKEYNVSYFNGPTLILNGLLHGFTTQQTSDDTLVEIQMVLSKTPPEISSDAGSPGPTLEKLNGVSPI